MTSIQNIITKYLINILYSSMYVRRLWQLAKKNKQIKNKNTKKTTINKHTHKHTNPFFPLKLFETEQK